MDSEGQTYGIERAVADVIERGAVRTYDMGGNAGTMDMARGVAEALRAAGTGAE
jgi:isocitrate/isopropylmalate dehydrogenase